MALTFKKANDLFMDALVQDGWTVKRQQKVPTATKDGWKLWIRSQSVHCKPIEHTGHELSLHIDTRNFGHAAFMWVRNELPKQLANMKTLFEPEDDGLKPLRKLMAL